MPKKTDNSAFEFEDYTVYDEESRKQFLVKLRAFVMDNGGFRDLSNKTGLSRTSLYKTLSHKGNPRWDTLLTIINALGVTFSMPKKPILG